MLALSGCCANDVCACGDAFADALYFRFQTAGPNRFWYRDIDTLYISRTTHPSTTGTNPITTPVTDSVMRVQPLTITASGDTSMAGPQSDIIINNATPFASAGGNIKLSAYDYHISTRRITKAGVVRYSFLINNIKLTGRYNATGCCTCYENTSKQFDLTDLKHVVTTQVVTDQNGVKVTTLLTK